MNIADKDRLEEIEERMNEDDEYHGLAWGSRDDIHFLIKYIKNNCVTKERVKKSLDSWLTICSWDNDGTSLVSEESIKTLYKVLDL